MEPRNYAANADGAPPVAPVSPSNGFPRAADPGAGQAATIPGPFWFYKMGEGIRSVIADAGLTPSDADLTLFLQAIRIGSPSGMRAGFAMENPPAGWLVCDGSAVSRASYSSLFTAVGTVWGVGDGATTFNLPDDRGQFLRGFDNGRGVDAGRVFGAAQLDALQQITGSVNYLKSELNDFTFTDLTGAFSVTSLFDGNSNISFQGSGPDKSFHMDFDSSRVTRAAIETRPTNNTDLICIRY